MLFALICIDRPGALEVRMAAREAHLAYVRPQLGMLKLGGPLLDAAGDMVGSLMIVGSGLYTFAREAQARRRARAFPTGAQPL